MKRILVLTIITCLHTLLFAQSDTTKSSCFNTVEVRVIAPSDVVVSGDKIEAEIVLMQQDTNSKAKVFVNGWKTWDMQKGKANYTTFTVGEGTQMVKGYVDYFVGDQYRRIPFEKSFTVIKAAALIKADAMNMLYVGIENPITIAVPGYSSDKIDARISEGELIPTGPGTFVARIYKRGEVAITATVRKEDGSLKVIATEKFRVRNAPRLFSQASLLLNGGIFTKEELLENLKKNNQIHVSTGEGFAFERLKFTVASFTFTLHKANGKSPEPIDVKGAFIPNNIIEMVEKAEAGDKIIIDNIKMAAPDEHWEAIPIVNTIK